MLMVSFKNITIISDDIEFVEALGGLVEDSLNFNIKKVNSERLQTKDLIDKPDSYTHLTLTTNREV